MMKNLPNALKKQTEKKCPENYRCQKCLQLGHFTYECQNERKYVYVSARQRIKQREEARKRRIEEYRTQLLKDNESSSSSSESDSESEESSIEDQSNKKPKLETKSDASTEESSENESKSTSTDSSSGTDESSDDTN